MSFSPSPSPTSLSRSLTPSRTKTPSASAGLPSAASTSGLSADGQIAIIVVFSLLIFLGSIAFSLWLWRRRHASTSGQLASPRDALFMPRLGAAAAPGGVLNFVIRWLAEAKSRLCPSARNSGSTSAGPSRAGPAGPAGPAGAAGSSAPALIETPAQSSLPKSQTSGNSTSLRAPPQAKTLYERTIGTFFSNTAARPLREMRANNLPINLSSRNFQVSNPLASRKS